MAESEIKAARQGLRAVRRWIGEREGKNYRERPVLSYRGITIQLFEKTHERARYSIDLFIYGFSCREVERKAKLHRHTLRVIRAALKEAGMLPTYCPCGKPHGHKGWCKDRLERSPKRREFMKRLHDGQKGKRPNNAGSRTQLPEFRECRACHKEKSIEDFHFTDKSKRYRKSVCRKCHNLASEEAKRRQAALVVESKKGKL